MSTALAYQALLDAGIQAVVAVPDSGLAPLCRYINNDPRIDYIQAVHESVCVGIATGLSLSGVRSLVIMENSGLRSACETIARFHLSHHLFTCYLLSHRGAFGERNWWGLAHHQTMEPLLKLLDFHWDYIHSLDEFSKLLNQAYATLATGQCGVALIAGPNFIGEISR